MSKPPTNFVELKIRLTEDQHRRIKAIARNYGVAKFIRVAVDHELEVREWEVERRKARQLTD